MDPFDWKELFAFSARERRGIYALLFLILLVLLAKGPLTRYAAPSTQEQDTSFQHQVEQWLQGSSYDTLLKRPQYKEQGKWLDEKDVFSNRTLFAFDPNKAGEKELKRLGFSRRAAGNLLKYREKGGHLDTPGELLKIYGMDSAFYQRVKDCIRIEPQTGRHPSVISRKMIKGEEDVNDDAVSADQVPDENAATDKEAAGNVSPGVGTAQAVRQEYEASDSGNAGDFGMSVESVHHPPSLHLELNGADTFQLARLPGIGRVYAKRICKYRDLLGGYADHTQLREVYGLQAETVATLKKYLWIDTTKIRCIPVNRAGYGDLIRHPYLDDHQTRAILYYRSYRKGAIEQIKELLDHNILDQKTYQQMQPYLSAGLR
jgi:DNA uptake protein ComE-like DNA-binding protein